MRSSPTTSWTRLSLFLSIIAPLSPVSASSSTPFVDSTHAAISSRSDSVGEIANDADLPAIAPESSSPPRQHHVSLNIHSPVATIHQHTHQYAGEQTDGLPVELIEPAELLRRATSSFPQPFDTSLGTNFTSESCPSFFNDFLSDSSFTNCHAISMLLRDSNAFFHTVTSAPATSHILDLACAANVRDCTTVMSDFASNLLKDDNCGQDYADGNPLVTDAYTNFITYQPIYRATCLQNPDTTDYCFVDAATNTSNSANYNVYFLPYGSTITSAPFPSCNACLQASLDIFSNWAQEDGQPLVDSYLPSAVAINRRCGAGFANVNITVGTDQISSSTLNIYLPNFLLIVVYTLSSISATTLFRF